MTRHFRPATKTGDYPFLAHPPPQRKRPLQPLPSTPSCTSPESAPAPATRGPHRRSSTFSAIASWAAHVQPGSPTSLSPRSPHRRPSLPKSGRPSLTSIRAAPAPFLQITATPTSAFTATPSVCDFKADLTAVGYTSVFLQLPNTPISATPSLSIKRSSPDTTDKVPIPIVPPPTGKHHAFTSFRSLSFLRSRGRSKSACPGSPARTRARAAVTPAAIVKREKAKYAMRPPPLANELAFMQFTDGGSLDDNIKRVMETRAKVTGGVGLTDVYRDGNGGLWWDQDEVWEYAHLLGGGDESRLRAPGNSQWVTFSNPSHSTTGLLVEERPGSVSTQDSDLDPRYAVQPVDLLDGNDFAVFGSAIVSTRKPPASVLSVPDRSCRAAQHLQKPDFLVDAAFPLPHASPKGSWYPASSGVSTGVKPKGRARRRPAPLKLSPPGPASKQPINSSIDADKVRKDFIATSFKPTNPVSFTPETPASVTTLAEVHPQPLGNGRENHIPGGLSATVRRV